MAAPRRAVEKFMAIDAELAPALIQDSPHCARASPWAGCVGREAGAPRTGRRSAKICLAEMDRQTEARDRLRLQKPWAGPADLMPVAQRSGARWQPADTTSRAANRVAVPGWPNRAQHWAKTTALAPGDAN